MITIYCLFNPITRLPFYVGATRSSLHKRLKEHLAGRNVKSYTNGKSSMRNDLLKYLMNNGIKPEIYSLIIVSADMANYCEKYFYTLFISQSIDLLQSGYRFTYQQHYYKNKS